MLGNSFRRKVGLLLLCSLLSFLKGIWSMGIGMPPQDPPRPLTEAGIVMPPEDPPRPSSPGPPMENPNPGG